MYFYKLFMLYTTIVNLVISFNLDTEYAVLKTGLPDTLFGFSVSQHQNGNENWLLVGAPQDNSDFINENRTGAVYKCSATSLDRKCEQIKFDDAPSNSKESKVNQWFGVALKSGGKDQPIISCAHRYTYYGESAQFRLHEGRCWAVTKDFTGYADITPCRSFNDALTPQSQNHQVYGQCEAGASIDPFPEDEEEDETNYVIGAIGSLTFAGRVFEYSTSAVRFEGELDDTPANYDSYFGYSVVHGHFFDRTKYAIATGGPRHRSVGKVLLYSPKMKELLQELPNPNDKIQLSSAFGISLSAIDSNNDGFVELVVGAPFYAKSVNLPNQGIAYVYHLSEGKLVLSTTLTGAIQRDEKNSNFGYAVSAAGDLNLDGYNDLVVGAPLENDQQGAIYIYLGSKDGLKDFFDQHIPAEKIVSGLNGDIGFKGFGRSISGGLDMDGNSYSDVLVGAYNSSHAVLLRSRPVIEAFTSITFDPPALDATKRDCTKDGLSTNCFNMVFCFNFSEPSKKIYKADSIVPIQFTIKADPIAKRVLFDTKQPDSHTYMFTGEAKTSQDTCERIQDLHLDYEKSGNIQIFPDISFEVVYSLPYGEDGFNKPTPSDTNVVNLDTYPQLRDRSLAGLSTTLEYKLKFKRECTTCIPDLAVSGPRNYTIRLGQSNFQLNFSLENKGPDPAYSVDLKMFFPPDLDPENVLKNGKTQSCGNMTCENIFYQFKQGEKAVIALVVNARRFSAASANKIKIKFTSVNMEKNDTMADNEIDVIFDFKVEADVEVSAGRSTQQVLYSGEIVGETAMKTLPNVGPTVDHKYLIENNGPDLLPKATLTINWPYEVQSGKHLLYLVDVKATSSKTQCKTVIKKNLLNLPGASVARSSALKNEANYEDTNDNTANDLSKQRVRRDTSENDANTTIVIEEVSNKKEGLLLDCETARCTPIVCEVFDLESGNSEVITVESSLWQPSLLIDYYGDVVKIVSNGRVSVGVNVTYIKDFNLANNQVKIYTYANPVFPPKSQEKIAIWIIALAVIAGVILLAVLIFGLYKLGFFKRQRSYKDKEDDKADSALLGSKYK